MKRSVEDASPSNPHQHCQAGNEGTTCNRRFPLRSKDSRKTIERFSGFDGRGDLCGSVKRHETTSSEASETTSMATTENCFLRKEGLRLDALTVNPKPMKPLN